MENPKDYGFNSQLIHYSGHDDKYGSATVPIYQTSTFAFDSAEDGAACFAGTKEGYIYTRIGNPTVKALERQIALLEHGYDSVAVSSGMAAVSTVYMALLSGGDHMISSAAVYGPSRVVMEQHFSRFGVQSSYVNSADVENIKKEIRPNTKMIFIESPANPTMDITDIAACAEIAHSIGAILVVDNTFCSPYLQNPIDMGADVVLHSITKFINGHADIVGGVIIGKEKIIYDKLRTMMVNMGCNMDPHQAYLVIRGLKTLGIRVDRAQENAIEVAKFLENHPKIEWIKYPGLKSFAQKDLVEKQMKGPGTMISFGVKGGLEAGKKLMNNVKMCILAVSLGGIETLIQHPASMTHSKMSPKAREDAGISEGLVRFSVGIENVGDIIGDLRQALEKI
ncbi:MAG: aminotransferase class I/II-fold pyridoxal phosphate-dependent enzyme [Bacteroidales bacterium]|nr:aminotransferase class I/II-fold pyridoxal phosphate-dependent enzyme [Bacteroidales bacterium]MDD4529567.1 aminotransferase class I/II-fold pyridoxal phosphate-dependent enzyme [Bacteroidales bacterium]MDD4830327.1 aminotransferase class I/II-fold pyridoxal phosphate-dependent enzyme [Bacteroidales bacterium]